jgi:hypothetical protein
VNFEREKPAHQQRCFALEEEMMLAGVVWGVAAVELNSKDPTVKHHDGEEIKVNYTVGWKRRKKKFFLGEKKKKKRNCRTHVYPPT